MKNCRSNLVVWAFAVAAVLGVGLCGAHRAAAATLGMVADNNTKSVTVFDADTDTVLGAVALPGGGAAVGDCAISADQTRGFVTTFANKIWVIDLTTSPPSLAAGPNPIPISNPGEDSAISPDGKYLITCDATSFVPVSVVDIATQTEIGTFSLGSDCDSVDVCSDGSVLVTSFVTGTVRRLTIDGAGTLTDTGDSAPHPGLINVYCAPGAASGVGVRFSPASARSFTIPGLGLVDDRALTGSGGVTGLIHPDGSKIFMRSFGTGSRVEAFTYNSATGAIGAAPILSIPAPSPLPFFGMDQIALHPDGTKLYVPQPGVLAIYDADTGAPFPSIFAPSISAPTGVAFASVVAPTNEPPTADAGLDQTVECTGAGAATVTLDGSGSSDPDGFGDIVDFEWREGLTVLASGASPTANVSLALGLHTITLTVTDADGETDSDTVDITVEDATPPLITAPAPVTAECTGPAGTAVALGSPVASDVCGLSMVTNDAPGVFPLGMTLVTWTATDTSANSATDTQLVTVEDTTPPTLTVSVTPSVLWPPTHKMIEITPTITVADVCDAAPTVVLLSITMDEGDLTQTFDADFDAMLAQGDTMDDIIVDEEGRIFLRAERIGGGDGRAYTLTYEAMDGSTNSTTASATVTVPLTPP